MEPTLTESTEMYLITVYRLTQNAPFTSTSDIAATMGVSLPSVSEKVKRLAEQGYMLHEWRQGVSLTDEGQQIALKVLRKHRLIATFLVEKARYTLDEIHEEACRLEHVISDQLADRLEELLEYPKVDPQGNPIPARDGTVAPLNHTSLDAVAAGTTVVVRHVDILDQDRLRYVCELGLVPNVRIRVLDVAPFEGPLTLKIGERTVALALTLAQDIGIDVVGKEA